jgi:putative FmdB family regulatory protein
MPIYEYLCRDCSEKFEKIVFTRNGGTPVECPRCGRTSTEQLLSTFSTSGGEKSAGGCAPGGRFT